MPATKRRSKGHKTRRAPLKRAPKGSASNRNKPAASKPVAAAKSRRKPAKKSGALAKLKASVGGFLARITGRAKPRKRPAAPPVDARTINITSTDILSTRSVGEPSSALPVPTGRTKPPPLRR